MMSDEHSLPVKLILVNSLHNVYWRHSAAPAVILDASRTHSRLNVLMEERERDNWRELDVVGQFLGDFDFFFH
jgi:hypothetical protein